MAATAEGFRVRGNERVGEPRQQRGRVYLQNVGAGHQEEGRGRPLMCPRKAFCPAGDRTWMDTEDEHVLSDSQARLGDAAESTRASTLGTRRRPKYTEPEDIKNKEREAAKCRHLVQRKSLRKEAEKSKESSRLERGLCLETSDQQASCQKVVYQRSSL